MLTIDKSDEANHDFKLGYADGIDGNASQGQDIPYRKGYIIGQCDRDDVNKRLSRIAQRFDEGEFQGRGEYLVAVTNAVAGE